MRMNMNANRNIGDRNHAVVFQRYALEFLHDLSEIFRFSSIRPKPIIAGRYLDEQKGVSLFYGSGLQYSLKRKTNGDMIQLRNIRDRALTLAANKGKRVNRILDIVDS